MTFGWGSLPGLCLRRVFMCLRDVDRARAGLVCRHWYHEMRSPSLWRSRIFYFKGRLSKYRRSERFSAVGYACSLGAYLERLEVCVCPPRTPVIAQRLQLAITGLFAELNRVNAPVRSLSLIKLELDRTSWTAKLRNAVIDSLITFLRRRPKITSICLSEMRTCIHCGVDLLIALSQFQRFQRPRCHIASLDLQGFFSGAIHVHRNPEVPSAMRLLRGLTDVSLSYSCLSDELLISLHRQQGQKHRSGLDANTLQTFSLYCTAIEPHEQMVRGRSWATLASSCPDLRVKIKVDEIINPDLLAGILLPQIPLTEYNMTGYYSDDTWSAKPVLCHMLPQYRCTLQHLALDLSTQSESLDEELVELVKVCERLEQLRVFAFLQISTVEKLLHIRLKQRRLLNKIRVRIYTLEDNIEDQEDELEEILCSYLHLPPELEFYPIIYPYLDH